MTIQYLWVENYGKNYEFSVGNNYIFQFSKLNFFIGKNNSGKSRFLRKLFLYQSHSSNFSRLETLLENLLQDNYPPFEDVENKELVNSLLNQFSNLCQNILPYLNADPIPIFQESYVNFIKECIEIKSNHSILFEDDIIAKIDEILFEIMYLINKNWNKDKFYISILRGMRPVQDKNQTPYLNRTKNDYFAKQSLTYEQIITGENLYVTLQKQLLGKAYEWKLVREYEQKLSQYFFDNQEITLIPELDSDMVSIKIGEEEQLPISQLGDGLQQVIILTYQAFMRKGTKSSFFIEEPELHMHAGMLRQLMNFYLNETDHYYFFTTHSNHLLDMADESDEVIIQKFVKETNDKGENQFKIYRCDRDRELLQSLGVKPSSVYLANCTIWVEGITDRLYLVKYMEKYLKELEESNPEKYKAYRRFMPNYHYAFVEYAGANMVHWDFDDDFAENMLDDKGLSAKAITSDMLLIADGDTDKADRITDLKNELSEDNLHILEYKEIENTLPLSAIIYSAKQIFERKKSVSKNGFDIAKLNNITDETYFLHQEYGIGRLLDEQIRDSGVNNTLFANGDIDGVGTIKDKLKFCRKVLEYFDDENHNWQLTESARELCEKIYQHIERCNSADSKESHIA